VVIGSPFLVDSFCILFGEKKWNVFAARDGLLCFVSLQVTVWLRLVTATIAIGCGVYARRMQDIRARIRVSAADDGLAKVWNLLDPHC
jgi:hypothetical protein